LRDPRHPAAGRGRRCAIAGPDAGAGLAAESSLSPPERPELSLVLPVYNEAPLLPELHRRLLEAALRTGLAFEVVYVDDGSSDLSLEILRGLSRGDARVVVLGLSRNFGHQIALTAGLDHARGDAVVLMDSDLQDPPELIPELVATWREGFDVVYARRRARSGESPFKRATAYGFYRFMRWLASVDIPADTGDFRLLSRPAADALRSLRERRRFLRGLVAWTGFRQGHVLYDRAPRRSGESKYSVRQMVRLALFGLFSFSNLPVAVVGLAGTLVCVASLLALLLGTPAATAGLFFLGGVQLLAAWILGQYVAAAAEEARGRPLYVIRTDSRPDSRVSPDA
jgi:dolichol-phosphate mannosyltransferase